MNNDTIVINEAEDEFIRIIFKEPLNFLIGFDISECKRYYRIDDSLLDIQLCEKNIKLLKKSLNKELLFIYKAYARECDINLSKNARKLKYNFLSLILAVNKCGKIDNRCD